MPKNLVFFNKLEVEPPFPVVNYLNVSNLPDQNILKQYGTCI